MKYVHHQGKFVVKLTNDAVVSVKLTALWSKHSQTFNRNYIQDQNLCITKLKRAVLRTCTYGLFDVWMCWEVTLSRSALVTYSMCVWSIASTCYHAVFSDGILSYSESWIWCLGIFTEETFHCWLGLVRYEWIHARYWITPPPPCSPYFCNTIDICHKSIEVE